MRCVAVVDIGKTNAKLAIVDRHSLKEKQVLTTPNIVKESPPYPHFDVDQLWDFVINGLTTLAIDHDIAGISITTHGASIALLDQDGQLATPIVDYEYNYPDSINNRYNHIRPPFSTTGSPRLSAGLNAGAQLYWLFTTFPALHDHTHTILTYPQYWAYRLSGVSTNELTSLGCHTDLWNPHRDQYSGLVDTLNIRNKMAPIAPASQPLGNLLPEIASATSLAADTPVYCGIHDSNASLLTHLQQIERPFSVVSTGTWVICMSPGAETSMLDESRDTLLNVNALGEATPSSRFMGGREYDMLIEQYAAEVTQDIIVNQSTTDTFILPAVDAASGPYQHSTCRWTVDPQTLTAHERYTVISFYLAMMTDTCLTLCQARGPTVIEGPFAANPVYCAMLSAATRREVLCHNGSSTGTSIGAALLTESEPANSHRNDYYNPNHHPHNDVLQRYAHSWRELTERHINHQA